LNLIFNFLIMANNMEDDDYSILSDWEAETKDCIRRYLLNWLVRARDCASLCAGQKRSRLQKSLRDEFLDEARHTIPGFTLAVAEALWSDDTITAMEIGLIRHILLD
jgi:hypothetical protein